MSDRDGLKPQAELCTAGIRNTWQVRIDRQTGEQRPVSVANHCSMQDLNCNPPHF